MLTLFDAQTALPVCLPADADPAVVLAAADLGRDLRRLSGKASGFELLTSPSAGPSIVISTCGTGAPEGYTVSVTDAGVSITGTDMLGTVFGVYAFSRRVLGFSPTHLWTELTPPVREEFRVSATTFESPERKVRFRGWFINDEDLLTDWKEGGGTREIDYPYYGNVMHTDVLDRVIETALRLEMNLMIPSSFVDVDNPDEARLVDAVTRRGLYVTQHHVEPMGVSYFAADRYVKTHGAEGEIVSFFSNRLRMEEIWRYYAEKWARYGDRVVWQLGLRGKADEAVWKADSTMPMDDGTRGAILSDAIATEYAIIRDVLGHDRFYSTATLWNEGSGLYGAGYLRLPEQTIPIFSDFGIDQLFGEDFYSIGRALDCPFGVYYHVGFWSLGPHLAEGTNPEKQAYAYLEAAETGRLVYSIVNVSNVRPLHFSVTMNARILEDPLHFSAERETERFDREAFGGDAERVTALRKRYYASFAELFTEQAREKAAEWHFAYHEYKDLPFLRNPATDGQLQAFGRYALRGREYPKGKTRELRRSIERFTALYEDAKTLEKTLPEETRGCFAIFLRYQIGYMLRLSEWALAAATLTDESRTTEERRAAGVTALRALDTILEERAIEAEGVFEGWHTGEKKINIEGMRRLTLSYLKAHPEVS